MKLKFDMLCYQLNIYIYTNVQINALKHFENILENSDRWKDGWTDGQRYGEMDIAMA